MRSLVRTIIGAVIVYVIFTAPQWVEGVSSSCQASALQWARTDYPHPTLADASSASLEAAIISLGLPTKAQVMAPGWPPELVCTGMYYGVALGIAAWPSS